MLKDKLKELRKNKGWTQQDVADKLAIDASEYSRIEGGKIGIDVSKIVKLAEIYEVDFNQLLNNGVNCNISNSENFINNNYGYVNTLNIESENKILKEENAFLKSHIVELTNTLKK